MVLKNKTFVLFFILFWTVFAPAQGVLSSEEIEKAYLRDQTGPQPPPVVPSQALNVENTIHLENFNLSRKIDVHFDYLTASSSSMTNTASVGFGLHYQNTNDFFFQTKYRPLYGISYNPYNYSYSDLNSNTNLKFQYQFINFLWGLSYIKSISEATEVQITPLIQLKLNQSCQVNGRVNGEAISQCKIVQKSYFNFGLGIAIERKVSESKFFYKIGSQLIFGKIADPVQNSLGFSIGLGYVY